MFWLFLVIGRGRVYILEDFGHFTLLQ